MNIAWRNYNPFTMHVKKEELIVETNLPRRLPLTELPTGTSGVLVGVSAGKGLAGRLTSLGFTPGVEVMMLQNYGHGPLMVSVRGTRVALGRGEAEKIWIERKDS
jgi:ferrous iron transport protein A